MSLSLLLAEAGPFPDSLIRFGIRRRLEGVLRRMPDREDVLRDMERAPIALVPEAANRQHYEVPAAFFEICLGRHLKYSCGWWDNPAQKDRDLVEEVDRSEEAMLELTCRRAKLEDGQRVLELGCGWGSLSLWMARSYPKSAITSVSNSRLQVEYIRARAEQEGLSNLEVRLADMNGFAFTERADRVVSVEMIEHMRNWRALMERVATWLEPGGAASCTTLPIARACTFLETGSRTGWAGIFFQAG
ncbi:MAG: SAM-dependent methyltransferase [Desulfohalobiaceae bacterium]